MFEGGLLSPGDYQRIMAAVAMMESMPRGGILNDMTFFPGSAAVKSAKVQNIDPSSNSDTFSVKLYTGDAEVGDAFDVYALWSKASITLANYTPSIDDNVIVPITKNQDGDWFLVWPLHTAAGAVSVYKCYALHETVGKYNCYLQSWNGTAWVDADAVTVVVRNGLGEAGVEHDWPIGAGFISLHAAVGGLVPGVPIGYAYYAA